MRPGVLRASLSSLLLLGVLCVPLSVNADEETGSSTESSIVDSTPADEATSTEPITLLTESAPVLPTGVLLDNSRTDIDWDINGYGSGYFIYVFPGSSPWTTPNTVLYGRIQKPVDTPCSAFYVAGVNGLIVYSTSSPLPSFYNDHVVESEGGKFCDFYFGAGGIPPNTAIEGLVLSGANVLIPGSSSNSGYSREARYGSTTPGGFAFQLCGTDGCSGGFASSTSPAPPEPQISNVLFLPGIKGSRLYEDTDICDEAPAPCSLKLWEPYGDGVARKLLLDIEGKSKESVYVKEGDILEEVLGQRFYASFLEDLRQKDAADTYGSAWKWKAVPYDWRLSLTDIVDRGAKHGEKIYYDEATTSPYIIQTLRELAASSPTGKVTIIAHSNGGLVTKALLRKIGDEETAALVDKVIFVGVPQSGAPQTLGALLFGYGESLPGEIILPEVFMSKSLARQLAENSPMAYHLMPSRKYLADTQDPFHSIISFTGSHLYQKEQSAYGTSIDTIEERDGFLKALEGGREHPAYTDLTIPSVLNVGLITYANDTHDVLDSWTPPASVQLYQIAGWGVDTVSGISFYDEQKVLGATIGYKKQYRPIFVEDGDGVVPVPSALITESGLNTRNFWINLKTANSGFLDFDHGNIFEISELREALTDLVELGSSTESILLTYQPENLRPEKKLVFQLHSPLTLGLHDSNGNYTGLNEDGSVSEEVPYVRYGEFGDVKYLIAPAGTQYRLVLHGQSEGSFSLDIQEQIGTTTVTSTLADIPTTARTLASLTITNGLIDATALSVDVDGDHTEDYSVRPEPNETVQVTKPETENVTTQTTRRSSTSYHTNASYVPVPEVSVSVLASPAKVSEPPATTYREAHLQTIVTTGSTTNTAYTPETQTASAHDAFAPFAEWLKSLLYNLWKRFIYFLNLL